ncbi:unnamed protein product [Mytilus coruscus]|uniref:Death domain-containing protein n=1 Tax=Mytilus coruscus TaxID=42192 RepID=A0A6J8BHS9_MYTCO|nr:unnamed protein product [Mytilus coruscus]
MRYTSVLFRPNKTFHSFGFEAEEFYYSNPEDVDLKDWYFFKRFKPMLNEQVTLTKSTVITDNGVFGNRMKAINVVAAVLNGLKEHLFCELRKDLHLCVAVNAIHWILTVPAIWTKGGRQFLIDAAEQSGISQDQLTIILEPEAAFWFCNDMPVEGEYGSIDLQTEYIALHQGGKTTMITIHDGIGTNALKGIYETYGGDVVSKEFVRFLNKIFGGSVIQQLRKNNAGDFFKFMNSARREICRQGKNFETVVVITLPIKLKQAIESFTGIGEYEESFELPLLIHAVKERFPHLKVIVPEMAEFSVLRGAISYGFQTQTRARVFSPPDIDQVESEPLLSRLPQMNTKDFKALIANGSYASFENRVYLAGACNVGKSCLASILIGEKIPRKWYSTNGLTIYFGRNGIHLKNREMIPLKKSSKTTSIVQRLILGNPGIFTEEQQYFDNIPIFRHRNVDDDEIELEHFDFEAANTNLSENPCQEMGEVENQDQHVSKEQMKTKATKKRMPFSTPIRKQQTSASIHKDILQQLREGKYKVEIAPSDLVDFGGQRTYDMTHQLFIQHQGTFVLMFDGRYGLHQPLTEYLPQNMTAEDILVHWVNSILLYCKDDDDIMPMILFAATHRDLMKTDVLTAKRKFTQELNQLFCSHVKRKHIMYDKIFFVNATDPKDLEIQGLKDTLVDIAFKQSTWGQRMPLAWVPLALQMSEMRTKNISLIPKGILQELNRLNEEFTLSEHNLEEFLKIQHSLGKVLYFDTPGIGNFIVIQPTFMVNILRSFITDKLFWPNQKKIRHILENISSTGKVRKEELFQIWSQPQFEEFVPTTQHKEYITQVLIHLDILVEPQHNSEGKTDSATYFVPCVVLSNLPPDLYSTDEQTTICLAYHLKESLIPSALTFKLIAALVTIWPLREINGRHCLYFQSAILKIDDSNQLLVLIKGQRVVVYLSNNVSRHLISPDVAASIQEYLTSTLQRVLYFYHECFGNRLINVDVASLFETEVGMLCGNDTCLIPLDDARDKQTWLCKYGRTHESKYCLYWVFDKEKKTCNPECKGLDADALSLHPSDKHLVRLAEQIGISVFDQFIVYLGLTREEWENIEYQYTQNGKLGVQLMALYECEKKKQKKFQTISLQDLLDALNGITRSHSLCQIVREETSLIGIADTALQEIPTDDVLNRLPRQLGNCVIQLGIELGLSFNSIEETMYNYSKDMYSQLYDILKKWKQSSKEKPSVYTLMKALQRTDSGGLTFLREQYANS